MPAIANVAIADITSFYGGPLRGILGDFQRRHVLKHVQTMILDGLSVTSELITEIISSDRYSVRILSIREVQNLNERKLMQALEYTVRPSRPTELPRLRGLYIFGKKDAPRTLPPDKSYQTPSGGVLYSIGAQIGAEWNSRSEQALHEDYYASDRWYKASGPIFQAPAPEWAQTLMVCKGLISFDAILCTGPRHIFVRPDQNRAWYCDEDARIQPRVAHFAVGSCTGCGSVPEGIMQYGKRPVEDFPLLSPPPTYSSTLRAATKPPVVRQTQSACMIARCQGMKFCSSFQIRY